MEPVFFEQVLDALTGAIPSSLGTWQSSVHRGGIKVWFEEPHKVHYEAQLVRRDGNLAVEIGFHAEHPKVALNQAALEPLASTEKAWRKALGTDPVIGEFLGRSTWRRVSEDWADPQLDDFDFSIEVAARLAEYIEALEPQRRKK